MQKIVFVVLLSLLFFGCNSKPVEEKQQKPVVREEKEPDPYEEANSDDSSESQDPQKGYFDPLRDIKDLKKEREEDLEKKKEMIDDIDNDKTTDERRYTQIFL